MCLSNIVHTHHVASLINHRHGVQLRTHFGMGLLIIMLQVDTEPSIVKILMCVLSYLYLIS